MANFFKAVRGELINQSIVRFLGRSVKIGVQALVRITLVSLGIVQLPFANLVFVNPDLVVFDPGIELV